MSVFEVKQCVDRECGYRWKPIGTVDRCPKCNNPAMTMRGVYGEVVPVEGGAEGPRVRNCDKQVWETRRSCCGQMIPEGSDCKCSQPARSPHQNVMLALPEDAGERKAVPIVTGVLDYFPAALAEVARLSKRGNDQHNPGQPLHWARGKSSDHADCIGRHLAQRGTLDTDGVRHSAKVAWRALALLQEELEAEAGFDPDEGDA